MYKITINNHRKVRAIQDEFNAFFPQLNIQFYVQSNHAHGGKTEHFISGSRMTLADCRNHKNDGEITISDLMNVGELKAFFANSFGLSVELFQKSGKNEWSHLPALDSDILKDINLKMKLV